MVTTEFICGRRSKSRRPPSEPTRAEDKATTRKNGMDHVVIVLPTYNEAENIGKLLDAIQNQARRLENSRLSVVVVDDLSPDGTGEIVSQYSKQRPNVYLLGGEEKRGLGTAYKRGIFYAINELGADIVFEMDADFSHDPNDIPRLLKVASEGSDFAVGSRYVPGGSIPDNWSALRKANSRWGNIFARHIAGLRNIRDCTSGYRAIRTDLLRKIDLNKLAVTGYAFQMSLLHAAVQSGAVVSEIPIRFTDRVRGESKIGMSDIVEFMINSFEIRLSMIFKRIFKRRAKRVSD